MRFAFWDVARSQEEIEENMYVEIESDPGLVPGTVLMKVWEISLKILLEIMTAPLLVGLSSGFTLNRTPDDPVFNSPANSATKVVLSPTLDVTVDDYEEDDVIVTFMEENILYPTRILL